MLGSGHSPEMLCGSVVPQWKESCGQSALVQGSSLHSARTFVLWTSLGAQHSGQLAKRICQGRGCLATQKLLMTQKHAEALPTMKGQGRKPRPTAWRSEAAPIGTAVARGLRKKTLSPFQQSLEGWGQIQQGAVWLHRATSAGPHRPSGVTSQELWFPPPPSGVKVQTRRAAPQTLDTYQVL